MPERAPSGAPSRQPNASLPQQGLAEEYDALENTLRNSTLGRWFLAEHARRNRTSEIQLLLDAMTRLEAAVLHPHPPAASDDILAELARLSEAMGETRRQIAELNPLHWADKLRANTQSELDQIMDTEERATSSILSAAEDIQNTAHALRERGAPPEICNRLDRRTLDIHIACASQDIARQKTAKVVRMLDEADRRIRTMIGVAHPYRNWQGTDEETRDRRPPPSGDTMPIHEEAGGVHGQSPPVPPYEATASAPPRLEGERFQRPEPLSLPLLHAVKRGALFG